MIWWLLLSIAAYGGVIPTDLECQNQGKIRYVSLGKQHIETAAYCYSKNKSYFLSASCRDRDCAATKTSPCKVSLAALSREAGNPGFQLCHKLKGFAQVVEFYDGKKWWSMDRCLFYDGSFVDTGILLGRRNECK